MEVLLKHVVETARTPSSFRVQRVSVTAKRASFHGSMKTVGVDLVFGLMGDQGWRLQEAIDSMIEALVVKGLEF